MQQEFFCGFQRHKKVFDFFSAALANSAQLYLIYYYATDCNQNLRNKNCRVNFVLFPHIITLVAALIPLCETPHTLDFFLPV